MGRGAGKGEDEAGKACSPLAEEWGSCNDSGGGAGSSSNSTVCGSSSSGAIGSCGNHGLTAAAGGARW